MTLADFILTDPPVMEISSDLFCFVITIVTIFGDDWCPPLDKDKELIPVC